MVTVSTAAEAIQAKIAATERYATIDYGLRAIEAMGKWYGCTEEFAGASWAIWQFEEAIIAASEELGLEELIAMEDGCEWQLKRAKKSALESKRAATEAVKAIGTMRQLRIALAADEGAELALAA